MSEHLRGPARRRWLEKRVKGLEASLMELEASVALLAQGNLLVVEGIKERLASLEAAKSSKKPSTGPASAGIDELFAALEKIPDDVAGSPDGPSTGPASAGIDERSRKIPDDVADSPDGPSTGPSTGPASAGIDELFAALERIPDDVADSPDAIIIRLSRTEFGGLTADNVPDQVMEAVLENYPESVAVVSVDFLSEFKNWGELDAHFLDFFDNVDDSELFDSDEVNSCCNALTDGGTFFMEYSLEFGHRTSPRIVWASRTP